MVRVNIPRVLRRAVPVLPLQFANTNSYLADGTGPSSKGTDFVVAFLPNLQIRGDPISNPSLQLVVTTDEPETVTFTVSLNENLPAEIRVGFPLTTNVSYGEAKVIDMHVDLVPVTTESGDNNIERSKGIHIRTEGGKKVSVHGFNDEERTTDGFMAFPCDSMRNSVFGRFEYTTLSGIQRLEDASRLRRSVFLIVPCDDDTVVRITPSQLVTMTGLADLYAPAFPPNQVGPGLSRTFAQFTANSGQTILIGNANDLSGSIIRGSKPLAVFSGHECGNVPMDYIACDHLVEQMPPGMAFGHTFFVVPYAARVSGDQIRVGTLNDGTRVTLTCVTSPGDVKTVIAPMDEDNVIDRGETLTYRTPNNSANSVDYKPSYCCLDASEPVVVAQYGTGFATDSGLVGKPGTELGDPFMNIVPPVSQFMNNYTTTSLQGSSGDFLYRYINLAIAAEFFDNSAEARQLIKVNGEPVSPVDGFIPFYCSNGDEICGYGAQVEVDSGTVNIYHERSNYGLSVAYYAYQQENSYGFPQGYELSPISGIIIGIT